MRFSEAVMHLLRLAETGGMNEPSVSSDPNQTPGLPALVLGPIAELLQW